MEKVISLTKEREKSVEHDIVMPHLPHLFRLAFRLTGKSQDAEDLLHDVLVKIFASRQEMFKIERLRPWLTTVLYRTFIDQKRKHNRTPLHLVKASANPDEQDIIDSVASPLPGPEKCAIARENQASLMEALQSLNPQQQAVCVLHDIEGYPLTELETILSTPIGTLKSRLHRARQNLRTFLKQQGTFQSLISSE